MDMTGGRIVSLVLADSAAMVLVYSREIIKLWDTDFFPSTAPKLYSKTHIIILLTTTVRFNSSAGKWPQQVPVRHPLG